MKRALDRWAHRSVWSPAWTIITLHTLVLIIEGVHRGAILHHPCSGPLFEVEFEAPWIFGDGIDKHALILLRLAH